MKKKKEFPELLCHVIIHCQHETEYVRLSASIFLKNWVKENRAIISIDDSVELYRTIMPILGDEVITVRRMAGNILSELLRVIIFFFLI